MENYEHTNLQTTWPNFGNNVSKNAHSPTFFSDNRPSLFENDTAHCSCGWSLFWSLFSNENHRLRQTNCQSKFVRCVQTDTFWKIVRTENGSERFGLEMALKLKTGPSCEHTSNDFKLKTFLFVFTTAKQIFPAASDKSNRKLIFGFLIFLSDQPSKYINKISNMKLVALCSSGIQNLAIIFLGLLIVITIIGNTLVCLSPIYFRKLRHPSNYLLISLALSDLGKCFNPANNLSVSIS